ncbi:helicase-related protein [Desulfoferrobacter suflitae]|uniref:helicase-related protein n=1 Tax=Desulfoferrobacter suflitae TaxID=2865782 RepID=UPI00216433D4|nr:helicase-related protein [Desulfoferrobacter suflitae]MCK8603178.1 hypothetical protein [Desulfoferrobacter suflitae]
MQACRSLLLATATPMQLDPVEAADLIQLTGRAGPFLFDPTLMHCYYTILGKLVNEEEVDADEWEFLRSCTKAVKSQDPFFREFTEDAVIDGRIRLAARQWLEQGRVPRGRDRQGMLRLIFVSSPLSRVMLRHNRSLLEIYRDQGQLNSNLAERKIWPIPKIVMNDLERRVYDLLEAYCQGLAARLGGGGDTRRRTFVGFILSFLRLRFASSLFAIRETLRRLAKVEATLQHLTNGEGITDEELDVEDVLEESEDDSEAVQALLKDRTPEDLKWEKGQLQNLLSALTEISGASTKMTELLKVLGARRIDGTGRIRQTVVFTRFYDTLTDIVARLRTADPDLLIGTYSGQGGQYLDPGTHRMVGVEREEIKHRFLREEIDVLVCTDAAAEGLNLQTADFLVNFDLPWNPMKVEQRIGRIDRIGQKHETIIVLNLCYLDSAEQIVYDRLLKRLADAGAVVGTQQISLLPVTRDEFEELAGGSLSEHELEQRALERALLAKKRNASMEIPAQDLYSIYLRLTEQKSFGRLPIVLEAIWRTLSNSIYLRDLGCSVMPDATMKTMILTGRSQWLLNLLVVKDLLRGRGIVEDGDQPFWRLAGKIEEIYEDRDTIRARIPLEHARKLSAP